MPKKKKPEVLLISGLCVPRAICMPGILFWLRACLRVGGLGEEAEVTDRSPEPFKVQIQVFLTSFDLIISEDNILHCGDFL